MNHVKLLLQPCQAVTTNTSMGKKPEKNGGKTKSTDFDTFEYENFDTARAGDDSARDGPT